MTSGGFEYEEAEEHSSPWLSEGGTFHFMVMAQDPNPTNKAQTEHLNGLKLTLGVVAAADPSLVNKTWDVILWRASDGDEKKQRDLNNRRLDKLFTACGIQKTVTVGPDGKKKISVDTTPLVTRQFIGVVEKFTGNNGKSKLNFRFDEIYHVDDPKMAAAPKNAEALSYIPVELRRSASSFTPAGQPGSGTNGTAAPAASKPVNPMDLLQGAKQPAPTAPAAPVHQPPATVPAVNPADV